MTPDPNQPTFARTPDEVQRAHDLLVGILVTPDLHESFEAEFGKKAISLMSANADPLCWMLGHDHNDCFKQNLELVEAWTQKRGATLVDIGELREPGASDEESQNNH